MRLRPRRGCPPGASRGSIRTSCVATWPGSVCRWSIEPSVTSGRCWCSVPPRATLSACRPRQMPRIGSPSRSACWATPSSNASSARLGRAELGCGLRAVAGGREVRAARQADARRAARRAGRRARARAAAARRAARPPARPRACRPCRAPSRPAAGRPRAAGRRSTAARSSDVVTPISGARAHAATTQVSLPPPFCERVDHERAGVERHAGERRGQHAPGRRPSARRTAAGRRGAARAGRRSPSGASRGRSCGCATQAPGSATTARRAASTSSGFACGQIDHAARRRCPRAA